MILLGLSKRRAFKLLLHSVCSIGKSHSPAGVMHSCTIGLEADFQSITGSACFESAIVETCQDVLSSRSFD